MSNGSRRLAGCGPRPLRGSSVKYVQYLPSSRLAADVSVHGAFAVNEGIFLMPFACFTRRGPGASTRAGGARPRREFLGA